MSIFRRRPAMRATLVAVTAFLAFFGLTAPNAMAFTVPNHETITRNALPADQVDQTSISQILVGPAPGAGVLGSDAFASEDFRHFDNAQDPAQICAEAQTAWDVFSPVALGGPNPAARAAFGALLHATQDFYSHTNWVELKGDQVAPALFPSCDPANFPANLHSGYFHLSDGVDGCPDGGPPAGFADCHETLNKDSAGHAGFEVASAVATRATTEFYNGFRAQVVKEQGEGAANCFFNAGQADCGGAAPGPTIQDPHLPDSLKSELSDLGLPTG